MDHLFEARVCRLVAENLGVGIEELTPDTSLTDDLAVDSLDLVELAVTLEGELGISFPERILEGLRSYGELVAATLALARKGRAAETPRTAEPALICTRIVSPGQRGGLERAGWLTPYCAEIITEDALRAGRGTRLDVRLAGSTSDGILSWVQHQFGWLNQRGIDVHVHRDHRSAGGDEDGRPMANHAA
jgi:acyl carrier protein